MSERFAFGKNWSKYLQGVDERKIARAEESLQQAMGIADLNGRSFVDVGCGSGIFSLAASRLGARVHSFDIDPECVACAEELRRRFGGGPQPWHIERGSALDEAYLAGLGTFDVVYSWGVLHHTGQMWAALENVIKLVAPIGTFYIAIYNDQGGASRRWKRIKRLYNRLPEFARPAIVVPAFFRYWGITMLYDLRREGNPLKTWRNYDSIRGMNAYRDLIDWVGGYPFEVATPDEIFAFGRKHGFNLTHLKTPRGGSGCNEFVFVRRGPT